MTVMTTPRGSLSSISRNLRRLARYGDVAGIRAYIRGDAFLAAFTGLDPERRHSAMLVYARAVAECEARARLPLAAPVALNARTFGKLNNWRDPAMLAKLATAYAQTKDHEGAARLLGVTVGAARLAKRRYLDRLATDTGSEARRGAVGGRFAPS
jgi:hypothetical protein